MIASRKKVKKNVEKYYTCFFFTTKNNLRTDGSSVIHWRAAHYLTPSISWVNMITPLEKRKKIHAFCLSQDRILTADARVAPIITEQTAKLGRFANYLQNSVSGGYWLLWTDTDSICPCQECFLTEHQLSL